MDTQHAPGRVRVGCAGWALPSAMLRRFGGWGTHLQRYATRLNGCEINSSFYRPHGVDTYRRWAASVPDDFRFSVKVPQAITHDSRLSGCERALGDFIGQARGLGDKLACLLVQLPPSLEFDVAAAGAFFGLLREHWTGGVAAEPRHASWFTRAADALLAAHGVARVLADPVRHADGEVPGGWPQLIYLRLHGSPRVYYSAYSTALIQALAARIELARGSGAEVWCIFDNTAAGAAADNALALQRALTQDPS